MSEVAQPLIQPQHHEDLPGSNSLPAHCRSRPSTLSITLGPSPHHLLSSFEDPTALLTEGALSPQYLSTRDRSW